MLALGLSLGIDEGIGQHAHVLDPLRVHTTAIRRYQHKSTAVTTNKAFAEWGKVFMNAACGCLVGRPADAPRQVVHIKGASCRAKGAKERLAVRMSTWPRPAARPARRSRDASPIHPLERASQSHALLEPHRFVDTRPKLYNSVIMTSWYIMKEAK